MGDGDPEAPEAEAAAAAARAAAAERRGLLAMEGGAARRAMPEQAGGSVAGGGGGAPKGKEIHVRAGDRKALQAAIDEIGDDPDGAIYLT